MSEKEKNRENNQMKFDLQDCLIDYAVRYWLPSPSLVTNRCVVEDNSKGKINSAFNKIIPSITGDRRVDLNTFYEH